MSGGSAAVSLPPGDVLVPNSPASTISALRFGSGATSRLLLAASWSAEACIWEVSGAGQEAAAPRARVSASAPLLAACFAHPSDSSRVFIAGCSGQLLQWELGSGAVTPVGSHSAPIRHLAFAAEDGCVISASWDRTLRYWDPRAASPQLSVVQQTDRLHGLDVKGRLCAVATADHKLAVYDLRKPSAPVRPPFDSPLRLQTRCLSLHSDCAGVAVGSVEGRVANVYFASSQPNFAFKCHRDAASNDVFAVNCIAFHPQHGTYATGGSDGHYAFWDNDSRQRLKLSARLPNAVTALDFSADGRLFATAVGYDWSKGLQFYDALRQPNGIVLHELKDEEIRKKNSGRK